ncbi:hypothetical protein ACFL9U_14620 [Thermodesulfobacteriota bacterium]
MKTDTEAVDYAHPQLDQEVTAIGGHYVLTKEMRIPFRNREVLYFIGHAAFDTTCCGAGGCSYALVPGIVVEWKYKTSPDARAVSLVKPIRDPSDREEIRRLVEEKEIIQQINFE